MARTRSAQGLAARQGVILLVVITLLTLFAVVGITFVIYAQAEASSMRVARQAETLQHPDADPEMLLAYYLSQLIYGPPNGVNSGLRNWDLARNMYGKPGNTIPFNGVGRLQGPNYLNLNYTGSVDNTQADQDGAPNPPYTYPDLSALFLAAVRPSDGAVLVPSFYRYGPNSQPIANGAGLPIMRAALPFAPEDGICDVKNLPDSPGLFHPNNTLTPNDSIWMDLGFPVMTGPDGRAFKPLFAALIQDLDNRVNVNVHGNNAQDNAVDNNLPMVPNWTLSHQGWAPGEVSPDWVINGSKYEAANLLNGSNFAASLPKPNNNSYTGYPGRYDSNSWSAGLFMDAFFGGGPVEMLDNPFTPGAHFYSCTDIDSFGWPNGLNTPLNNFMPQASTGLGFPYCTSAYANSWASIGDKVFHSNLYNYFDPTQSWYYSGGARLNLNNRRFPVSDMEALLRYSDRGSPALTSSLFLLCPSSFSQANTRRLTTTLSMDLALPGVMPAMPRPQAGATYQLASGLALGQQYPKWQQAPAFPAANALPSGEFGTGYYAMANAAAGLPIRNRIDLNRGFVDYPQVDNTNTFQFTNAASYQINPNPVPATGPTGLQSRTQMAQEIFNVLCTITGASCTVNYNATTGMATAITTTAQPGQPEYDALRYLAQLAVNIVDFVSYPNAANPLASAAPDDVMTMFNWNPAQNNGANAIQNAWVFGTVLPRLVLNEAYVEITNTPQDAMKPALPKPQITQYDINCWAELHNPFSSDSQGGVANGTQAVPTAYNGTARLYVPNGTYAAYRVLIAQTGTQGGPSDNTTVMTQNSNVLGLPKNIQTAVDQYTPGTPTATAPNQPQALLLQGDQLNLVQPINGNNNPNPDSNNQTGNSRGNSTTASMCNSAAGNNQGFYVLGPATPFPGTDTLPKFFATLPVKETKLQQNDPNLGNVAAPANSQNSMHYVYTPASGDGTYQVGNLNHTFVLQRLACPYMPPTFNPQAPNFNPYVTVDYLLNVPVKDAVQKYYANTGQQSPTFVQVQQRYSVGRNQPYAADQSQQVNQTANYDATQLSGSTAAKPPPAAPAGQQTPQSTFFCVNVQGQNVSFAFDWLFWANRQLVSPMELLHVSGYKPSQLTQMFVQGTAGQAPTAQNKFLHRAPWFDPSNTLYRALEFFEAGMRPQWSPIGGRFSGRINLNTLWDQTVFNALCDAQGCNYFTQTAVNNMWKGLTQTRTPQVIPMSGDRPFLGMAAPYAAAGNTQYPNGADINDTFLRADPANPPPFPNKRLFKVNYLNPQEMQKDPIGNQQPDQIYLRNELMIKIFGNCTTRSNVFAVWLTAGFFEVNTATGALGQEINKAEGRNVRHRMFAVLDRTNLTVAPPQPNQPPQAGPRPFFINSLTAVTQPGQATITVPASASNAYEEMTWGLSSMSAGSPLVVDSGNNQEVVTVIGATAGGGGIQITAAFTKPHAAGFPVSNAALGNPGPQPFFDPRNPQFAGVVRYFSVIQ